ncbi:MAG: hypothetical protein F6K21_03940 [Symploca sp. SIO2D2]|nr:hypothetical protein [Symploca sp. SIO2D2]
MPKNIPSLKPQQLIKLLKKAGCVFYREGKGDHSLYSRVTEYKTGLINSLDNHAIAFPKIVQ